MRLVSFHFKLTLTGINATKFYDFSSEKIEWNVCFISFSRGLFIRVSYYLNTRYKRMDGHFGQPNINFKFHIGIIDRVKCQTLLTRHLLLFLGNFILFVLLTIRLSQKLLSVFYKVQWFHAFDKLYGAPNFLRLVFSKRTRETFGVI